MQKENRGLFTHEMKYGDKEQFVIGGGLTKDQKNKISHYAKEIHKALGAEDFSQSEFIINSRGKIYFIEVNTNPGMTEKSLLPLSLKHVGSGIRELVSHIVNKRLKKT